jgi:hypothetical protein
MSELKYKTCTNNKGEDISKAGTVQMNGHSYTGDVKCQIFQTWALHGSKSSSGEILAPFHYASERCPSTNHTESSVDMTDVLNMEENKETLNKQNANSLLLTQLMYSYSLWLPN